MEKYFLNFNILFPFNQHAVGTKTLKILLNDTDPDQEIKVTTEAV